MIFDGKKFAEEVIAKLPKKKTKLAIYLDPYNATGARYVEKKIQLAKRLGVEIVMNRTDGNEDGIVVQLPHPKAKALISQIPLQKDVDGLKDDSPYMPAVVRAVTMILNTEDLRLLKRRKIVVVGSKGFVGGKLLRVLPGAMGVDKEDFDSLKLQTADIIISATGQKDMITSDMVTDGFIAIDVGYPEAEFTKEALAKSSFYTPVPGGVGPVTVACLFANLLRE